MTAAGPDTDVLLDRAASGDVRARQQLLERFRRQLRRMVSLRLDHRLAARVDPSDVVQEALADAGRKLDGYLRVRPLPFYPWLRQLAWERLAKLHRRHTAGKRDVAREQVPELLAESALELAERLTSSGTGPEQRLLRDELRERVQAALERLDQADRELLVLRHAEQLSTRDTAAVLGVTEAAIKSRHLRALERLRTALGGNPMEESS
jgi:RNA polymerase sigma-70 factor (ECF subfamily)